MQYEESIVKVLQQDPLSIILIGNNNRKYILAHYYLDMFNIFSRRFINEIKKD
jgi:hypothetical protein